MSSAELSNSSSNNRTSVNYAASTGPRIIPLEEGWNDEIKLKVRGKHGALCVRQDHFPPKFSGKLFWESTTRLDRPNDRCTKHEYCSLTHCCHHHHHHHHAVLACWARCCRPLFLLLFFVLLSSSSPLSWQNQAIDKLEAMLDGGMRQTYFGPREYVNIYTYVVGVLVLLVFLLVNLVLGGSMICCSISFFVSDFFCFWVLWSTFDFGACLSLFAIFFFKKTPKQGLLRYVYATKSV